MFTHVRRPHAVLFGVLLAALVMAGTQVAHAASYTLNSLTLTATGGQIRGVANTKASSTTTVSDYGIVVEKLDGTWVGEIALAQNVSISTTGRALTGIQTYPSGTYTAQVFVRETTSSPYLNVGAPKQFTLPGTAAPVGSGLSGGPTGFWALKFNEEFTGTTVDYTKWASKSFAEQDRDRGQWTGASFNNKQLEWNVPRNCTVSSGTLKMTAKPAVHNSSDVDVAPPSGYDWESCLLISSPSYSFRYGYMETRARMPGPSTDTTKRGFWPAFWTWQVAGLAAHAETDVYEYYSDNPNQLYLTQHGGAGAAQFCTLVKGTSLPYNFDPASGFHVYGAAIESGGTKFYIDGKLVCAVTDTSPGLANLFLSNFVHEDTVTGSTTTGTHEVDYVRSWQR